MHKLILLTLMLPSIAFAEGLLGGGYIQSLEQNSSGYRAWLGIDERLDKNIGINSWTQFETTDFGGETFYFNAGPYYQLDDSRFSIKFENVNWNAVTGPASSLHDKRLMISVEQKVW